MMRILLVMLEPPLPFGNAAARWFYVLLKGLVGRGHHVTAFAACSKTEEIEQARKLFPAPQYDLRCYPFPARRGLGAKLETLRRPYSYMFSRELKADLKAELGRGYDLLHLEQLWGGWLGLDQVERTLVNIHYLARIDLAAAPVSGWQAGLKQHLLLKAERRIVRSFKNFNCLSPRIAQEVSSINPRIAVSTVPLGLDPARYEYLADDCRTGRRIISVIGTMNWYPTYSAAERLLQRLWPRIKERLPDASVQIVGWNARTALGRFAGMPGVTIEENVPNIQPYFEKTGLLLYAPGRGSGMKVKVMEAMAFGVPVVTTGEGVEGLPAEDGVHAGICDDDEGLIERAVMLFENPAQMNRQRAAARQLIERHCGPEPTVSAIEAVYGRILAGAERRG